MQVERALCKARDASQELVCRLDPHERLGLEVRPADVRLDRLTKLPLGTVTSAAKLSVGEAREPALDLVQPGGVRRCEVENEAWMPLHEALHAWRLVRGEVVEHDMDAEVRRHLFIDKGKEPDELDAPMAFAQAGKHLASANVQRCEQVERAVPKVVVRSPLGLTRLHG